MAKEKKFKSVDEFGFDTELSIPSFDDFSSKRSSDDRHPATKVARDFARGTVSGIWDSARSESFIRKTLKQALPQGYGTALDMADQTGQSLKSLYDSSAREVKPLLNDMKRATGKLMPAADKILPKKVADRLKRWADSADNGSSGLSAEQARDQTLQATLGDIFKYQAETDAKQRAEDKAEADIRHQIQNNKSNMQLGALNTMRIALQRLADYQDRVTVNYQRKSLELQYRQYFVSMDTLAHQKETSVKNRELLENIQKNTGLPDVLKIKVREDFPTLARNKFFGTMGSMLLGNRSRFMQNLTENIQKSVLNNVKGFVGNARLGLSGAEMIAGMAESMGEDGPGLAEMGGGMVGGAIASGVGARLGRRAGAYLRRSKYGKDIERIGNKAEYLFGNVPQHLTEFANSDKGDDIPLLGRGLKFLKQAVRDNNALDTGLERDNLRSLQEPAIFTNMARKSITEIIPGYLARIYQELQIIRTGNPKIDLTNFDPISGKFKSRQETSKALLAMLVKPQDKELAKSRANGLLQELERGTGQKFSPELSKALIETLRDDNLKNRIGSPERLGNIGSYFGRRHYAHGPEMADVFRQYFANDADNSRRMRFQKFMNDLNYGINDGRGDIQSLLNAGYGDQLEEMGLFDKTGKFINLQKYLDYYGNESFEPSAQYAAGDVRSFGPGALRARMAMNARGAQRVKQPAAAQTASSTSTNTTYNVYSDTQPRLNVTYGGGRGYGPVRYRAGDSGVEETRLEQARREKAERQAKKRLQSYRRRRVVEPIKPGMPNTTGHSQVDFHLAGQEALIHAIETASSKSVSELMLEELKAIRKKFEGDGMAVNNYYISGEELLGKLGGHASAMGKAARDAGARARGWYRLSEMTVGDALKGAWSGLRSGAMQSASAAMSLPGQVLEHAKRGGRWARDKLTPHWSKLRAGLSQRKEQAMRFATSFDDVYLPGVDKPVLLAWKLRAGYYRDQKTGEVIQHYKDIKGTVIDASDDNNVALEADQIKHAYVTSKLKEKSLSALGAVWKAGAAFLKDSNAGVFALAPKVWDWGKQALEKGMHFLDQPIDVYVKNKSEPVLLARVMKAGGYVSSLTGKPITRPSQIDGPVIDRTVKNNPKMVLTREDLTAGLVDWLGKPIRTPGQKLWDVALKPFMMAKGAMSQGLMFAKALVQRPMEAIGKFFTNWFGADGIVFSGSKTMIERLTEIRDVLKDRLPKPKRIRRGSWEDQERRGKAGKQGAKEASSAGVDKGIFSSLGGLGSGIASLLSRFKKKDTDQAKQERDQKNKPFWRKALDFASDQAESAAEGYTWNKGKEAAMKHGKRLGSKMLRRVSGGKGRLGQWAEKLGERPLAEGAEEAAETGVKQTAKRAGGRLFGKFATRAAQKAASSGVQVAAEGALGAAAEGTIAGLGLEMGLGAALSASLGVAAATIGGILASPVVLGAAAVAIAGAGLYASYKGIKHSFTRAKLKPLSTVRMAQYGFKADDLDHIGAVMQFEDVVKQHVIYNKEGKASFDDKKLKASEAFAPFGIDAKNKHDVRNWFEWYQLRFKPVFLTHMTALHAISPKTALSKVDDMSKEEKLKYLKAAYDPGGPYGLMSTPFHQTSMLFMHFGNKLTASYAEVKAAVKAAYASIEKEPDTKKAPGAMSKFATGLTAAITGSTDASAGEKGKDGKAKPKSIWEKAGHALGTALKYTPMGLAAMGMSWLGHLFHGKKDAEKTKTNKPVASVGISPTLTAVSNKVDALQSLRYRTYGLNELDAQKVGALKSLEDYCKPFVQVQAKLKDYRVDFSGDPHEILKAVGASFGVVGVHNNDAYHWLSWFGRRFLPTYLTYIGALLKTTGKSDIHQTTLEPLVAAKLAPVIVAAKSPEGKSVWSITDSPWKGYELNTDQKSVDKIMDFLNGKITAKTLNDGTGVDARKTNAASRVKTGASAKTLPKGDGGKGWTDLLEDKAKNAWDTAKSWMKDKWNKGVSALKNSSLGKAVTGITTEVTDKLKKLGAGIANSGAFKAISADAKKVKDAVLKVLQKVGIVNPTEQAMFMAQMDYESGGFKSLSENLNYSNKASWINLFGKRAGISNVQQAQALFAQGPEAVADAMYGGPWGAKNLGNTQKGDGYKYRGRGIVQLTGRANYEKYGKLLGLDLVNNPDMAADPKVAALIAAAYWKTRVSSSAAQAGDVTTVTHEINGGENGLAGRQQKFQQYLQEAKAGKLAPAAGGTQSVADTGVTTAGPAKAMGTPVVMAKASNDSPSQANASPSKATPTSVAQTGSPATSGMTKVSATPGTGSAAKLGTVPIAPGTSAPMNTSANPFAFGEHSFSSAGAVSSSRSILAVQQAQHEDKMGAIGGVSDVLNKQLDVQSDMRDNIRTILSVLQQAYQAGQSGSANDTPAPAAAVTAAPNQRQMQPMVKPPVSMGKMV